VHLSSSVIIRGLNERGILSYVQPAAPCGPVERFMWPGLGYCCSKSVLDIDNLSFFDNLEFDIFDTGGPLCHFIASFTIE